MLDGKWPGLRARCRQRRAHVQGNGPPRQPTFPTLTTPSATCETSPSPSKRQESSRLLRRSHRRADQQQRDSRSSMEGRQDNGRARHAGRVERLHRDQPDGSFPSLTGMHSLHEVLHRQRRQRSRSCIIHVSSFRAHQSDPNQEGYAFTKAGQLGLMHSMAIT